jgi:hypothetical protein
MLRNKVKELTSEIAKDIKNGNLEWVDILSDIILSEEFIRNNYIGKK